MIRDVTAKRVLYVIVCGSSSAFRAHELVTLSIEAGWTVCVIATPSGMKFINVPMMEEQTGYPVRSEYKRPAEPDVLPHADAVVAFPATFNTLNKWALGISDTLAVGVLCEYTGYHAPIIAVPGVTTDSGLDAHPAFQRSINQLRDYGIRVIYEPQRYPPRNEVPCTTVLDELATMIEK
jgi:phosphopantothenoylcysteine synthetase/decarboxylase